jgi:ribonuclease P protein component
MPIEGIKPYLSARILTKRADFLRVKAQGGRVSGRAMALQYLAEPAEVGVAVGFTCAKRSFLTGVASNRGRRRLKEAWRQAVPLAKNGHFYVLVGKLPVLDVPFTDLVEELKAALARVPAAALPATQP